jgi:hypothetical protein
MKTMDNFEIEIIFQNVSHLIANKTGKISENSKFYLNQSIVFFDGLIKSLDSLGTSNQNHITANDSYIFFPKLREVVLSAPHTTPKISEKELLAIKKYFSGVINDIQKLKDNPESFYKLDKADQLRELADRLSRIHSEDFYSHTFETEETFSNSYFLC